MSVYYIEDEVVGNNGNIYFQLDELRSHEPGTIYRSIGAGFASKNKITMNEADDVMGILEVDSCKSITYTRNRDRSDSERRFTFNASNVKISTVEKRNKVLGCIKK